MNTMLAKVFTDETAEFNDIQSATPSIDLTDWPLPDSLLSVFTSSSNFLLTSAEAQVGYYEIEFHQDTNYWGCNFSFGNSPCGIQIRQGIAHMFDKTSFATNEPVIAGHAQTIDNPLPTTSGGGLPSPNPCAYDTSFPESGSQCVVGASGGVAYHLLPSTGANGFPWLYAPGSQDLNAAAQHFVNAGLATGFNRTTSVLTGISSAAASNRPAFWRSYNDAPRLDLYTTLGTEICYLFTGSYAFPCTYLNVIPELGYAFSGFTTSTTAVNQNWWFYIAQINGPTFIDGSLYHSYNSHFVSGIPAIQSPTGPCDPSSVSSPSASDYVYACDPTYDSLSTQMEFAPCLTAQGDPVVGATSNLPTSPGNGICSGTTQPSTISAGIQAEVEFGSKALTLPLFQYTIQYGYLNNGWVRVGDTDSILGLANYFNWLNGWNAAPVVPSTIRQGFAQFVTDVSPYNARTPWDLYVMNNVYDSLYAQNPEAPSQFIDWMVISTFQLSNSSLGYASPAHTLTTYRFTLRPDVYFQDGRPVTSYDVAFSYLSLVGTGAFLGAGAAPMTGITILGPHQFDISVNSLGPFTLPNLTLLPILPARYWTSAGPSAWDSAASNCTMGVGCGKSQYSLSGASPVCNTNSPFDCSNFSANLMTVNATDTSAWFDPIANHIFVGSGPWTCGTVTKSGSGNCTPGGTMVQQTSWTLTRFGAGISTCMQSNCYFRSSQNAALWIWSEQSSAMPFILFNAVQSCYGAPVNLSGPCSHWQQGIGNPGTGNVVSLNQISIGARFYSLNWVAPFDWASNPPSAIAPLNPILYEATTTYTPNPGGLSCQTPNNYYDC